jgi:hypothetical protein
MTDLARADPQIYVSVRFSMRSDLYKPHVRVGEAFQVQMVFNIDGGHPPTAPTLSYVALTMRPTNLPHLSSSSFKIVVGKLSPFSDPQDRRVIKSVMFMANFTSSGTQVWGLW